KVVDARKAPIASARVRIGAGGNPRGMLFEAPRQAYTDATGAFEIRGLPRKALAAVALAEAGASQTQELDTTGGDAEVTLVIDVTGTIAGVVVDPAGQPMEGVQVSAGPSFGDSRTPTDFSQWRLRGFPEDLTDSGGRFTLTGLAQGKYNVSASPARSASRGRRFMGGGANDVTATTGELHLKIVLPPEGAVKGKVQFADGKAPDAFTVSVGMTQQAFVGTAAFTLDALPPRKYELSVRGPSFQTRIVELEVESGKTVDAGTITVEKGRTIGGVVLADGQPVAGATVHVGRLVFGNGSTSNANFGPMGGATKHDTTDGEGKFMIAGFPEGDITIVAEHDTIGRSRAMRLPTVMPGQTELTLTLEKFGALSGVLKQGDKPAEGIFVACQSTTTPGALYSVSSGPDGSYRFDKLAPDTYKVSATLGMPMIGMKFYSKQIDVPAGKEVKIDLAVEPGTVTVEVALAPKAGKVGVANVYIASGTIVAKTGQELGLRMAAAGPGASQWVIIRDGEAARFSEVAPGSYTACAVPFPFEVRGMGAMGYGERHSDSLLAFCKPFTVAPSPATQAMTVAVELPPFIKDASSGSGAGSGAGSGSGPPRP
ncbi:MAG: carboxypeptidase regulatory-like domain-containing protein, partial [Proteobacteria bacterium]|nr:carboxypeptidase regulatory-like domain-containing protein [Pseudomonadota bacterium]